MKKSLVAVLSMIGMLFLSGCMEYAYNPEGVLQRAFNDLKEDHFGDFRDHFVGDCYRFASGARGFVTLQNHLKKYPSLNSLIIKDQRCDQVLGAKLPGYHTIFGKVLKQEECKMNVASAKTGKNLLSLKMSCFHWRETPNGATAHKCDITKLSYWRLRPDGVYKPYKLCEATAE